MTEEQRRKLAKKRRKEQKEKEFLADLGKDLHLKDRKLRQQELRGRYENEYVSKIIMFFGTLGPMYLFYFMVAYLYQKLLGGPLAQLGIDLSGLAYVFHILIWGSAIISVVRDRSVLDDIVDRFF